MMSRIAIFFFAFLYLLAGQQIYAAPARHIAARQLGNLQCNLDRLAIVAGLGLLDRTLNGLAGSNDTAVATGIQDVQTAVDGAQSAIGVIAKALITGQSAPAAARDQVKGNLTAALDALNALNSTDASVANGLTTALAQLQASSAAGEGVVANCK